MAKDMYNDKHTASAFLTFEQHQPDGWSTEIIQPSRSLSACLLTLLNQSRKNVSELTSTFSEYESCLVYLKKTCGSYVNVSRFGYSSISEET